MSDKLQEAVNILKNNNQQHLLDFFDELDGIQKDKLLNQILSIDFKMINRLYKDSKKSDSISPNKISPIYYYTKSNFTNEQLSYYNLIGESIIKDGKLAIFTLAGGQGTRLGYKGPKGSYEIDVPPKKSLFEFTCDKLKAVFNKYQVYLPWYIMTSPSNDTATKLYFNKQNYFGYPQEKIFFFKQSALPVIDTEGHIILDRIYMIKEASNGNGDIFKCFYNSGLFDTLLSQNIQWISVSGVDNIILDIIDPVFLGLTISNKSLISSKSIKKEDIYSKDWVFANIDGRPSIIDPKNLTEEMLNSKNSNGLYNYNQINILSHLFNISTFKKLAHVDLPYHRAFKKNDFINDEGMKVVPSSPNSFKFEKFIFDSFKYFKDFTLLEVNSSEEFAPIKAFTEKYTPEIALELYLKKFNN